MAEKISPETHLTFDDVLIAPLLSDIEPREANLRAVLVPGIELTSPFLSAAMDRVSEAGMAIALHHAGGLGVLHRNCSTEDAVAMVKRAKEAAATLAAACGPFDHTRAAALAEAGVDLISIDCAHGHNSKVIAAAAEIKAATKLPLVVGNIASADAVKDLVGIADVVKVGIGPGSICTTRIVSGVGVPQLSAILEVASAAHERGISVIADGGVRTSGDAAKAFAAGADAVMLGNLLAGTDEAPGAVVEQNGTRIKSYRGMGSREVMEGGRVADRYFTKGRKAVPEGVDGYVAYRGSVADVIAELTSGVQVAFGYVGARTLTEFHERARFVRVTPATHGENGPHSLVA